MGAVRVIIPGHRSTAGERAVGQRPHYRCESPRVFDRQVILSKYTRVLPTMTGQRSRGAEQLGEVVVLSAAGFGGGGLSRDAGLVHRRRPWRRAGRRVIEVAGQADRHRLCADSGPARAPAPCAPMPRSCCTRRVRPSNHAGSYDLGMSSPGRHRTRGTCSPRPAAGARRATGP